MESGIEILPIELQYLILYKLPCKDLLNYSLVNRYANNLINDLNFWIYKSFNDFGLPSHKFFNPFVRYLELQKELKPKILKTKTRPTDYNLFMKDEMYRIKMLHPEMSHKEVFKAAAANWKFSPSNPGNIKG